LLSNSVIHAQTAEDALRFSEIYYQGTARNMATGSALGAMGADFSTLSINPAGMGMYRGGEFSITPEVFNRKITSTYNGTVSDDARTVFDLSNMGLVAAKNISRGPNGWKYLNFGFGMNRLNNYNSYSLIQGMNDDNSRIDVYYNQALEILNDNPNQSISEAFAQDSPFYVDPAWQTYLLDTVSGDDGNLYLVSPVPVGGVWQSQYTETKGSNNEWLMSLGGNFNDRFYIGATLGFPYIRYYRENYYHESDPQNNSPDFNTWSVSEFLNTTGWGINFKIGVIAKPTEWMRIGVAYHTPTYYWTMRDSWHTVTTSDIYAYSLGEWYQGAYTSPAGEFDYKLTTPMRFIANAGFIIKNAAFITGTYEYANYSKVKFKTDYYSLSDVNSDINSSFTSTNNFRLGAEYRYSNLSFRGGFALYANPYKDNLNDGQRQSYSGGIGWRYSDLALDFAYVYSKLNPDYYLYSYGDVQTNAAKNKIVSQNFVLTISYRY
jgi:long-subunit fatty acid transport protein